MLVLVVWGAVAAGGCGNSVTEAGDTGSLPDGGGGSVPDSGVDDAGDDAGPPPNTILFRLSFISDVPESIWVNQTDSAWLAGGHWLTITRGGATIRKAPACEQCMCDACPNCPICGAPCPTVDEVASGSSVEWEWSGLEYPSVPCPADQSQSCQQPTTAPAGSYSARFCWGLSYEGTPPCPAEITSEACQEVPFTVPDPDGLVEHLVDHGG